MNHLPRFESEAGNIASCPKAPLTSATDGSDVAVKYVNGALKGAETFGQLVAALAEGRDLLGYTLAHFQYTHDSFHLLSSKATVWRIVNADRIACALKLGWPAKFLPLCEDTSFELDPPGCHVSGLAQPTVIDISRATARYPQNYRRALLDIGVVREISVPVYRPLGRISRICWLHTASAFSDDGAGSGLLDKYWILANTFFSRLDQLALSQKLPRRSPLTPREIECLSLSAQGKTDWEIGTIIGRSPETARFHIRKCIQKLHAVNRIHAVALATQEGLVQLNRI